jgi:hypothetical protein
LTSSEEALACRGKRTRPARVNRFHPTDIAGQGRNLGAGTACKDSRQRFEPTHPRHGEVEEHFRGVPRLPHVGWSRRAYRSLTQLRSSPAPKENERHGSTHQQHKRDGDEECQKRRARIGARNAGEDERR